MLCIQRTTFFHLFAGMHPRVHVSNEFGCETHPTCTVQNDHVGERKALAQIVSVILKPPDKKILSAGRFAALRHLKHGPTRALEF